MDDNLTPENLTEAIDLVTKYALIFSNQNEANDKFKEELREEFALWKREWGQGDLVEISVGSTRHFKNIQDAWNSLAGKVLKEDVLINVDDGGYEVSSMEFGHHPYADRIRIEGNLANPSACRIIFKPDANQQSHGVILRNIAINSFGGFQLEANVGSAHWNHRSIYLENSSLLIPEGSLKIMGAGNGIEVADSILYAQGLMAEDIHSQLVRLMGCSTVNMQRTHALLNNNGVVLPSYIDDDQPMVYAYGIISTDSSNVWCGDSVIEGGNVAYYPANGGRVIADNAIAKNCSHHGFLADNGSLRARSAKAEFCRHSFYSTNNSHVDVNGTESIGATDWSYVNNIGSIMTADNSKALSCEYGYISDQMAFIRALNTNENNEATVLKYSAQSEVLHNNNASIYWS